MPSFLAIETTTDTCSVAVYKGQHVIIDLSTRKPRVHAEQLLPMAREALDYAKLQVSELDGIVISGGPGSYTGLRIGASTAKGLAFAHNLALIAVPSLNAMAYACLPFMHVDSCVLIARNARKDELYISLYKKTGHDTFEPLIEPRAVLHDRVLNELAELVRFQGELLVAGEGGAVIEKIMAQQNSLQVQVLAPYSVAPSARIIAILGASYYENQQVEHIASYEPMYLKDFIPKKRTTSIFDRLPF